MMQCPVHGNKYFFVEQDGNAYCFSYTSCVAAIIDGEYIEYQGDKYFSVTSNRHKSIFRKYYGVVFAQDKDKKWKVERK